MREVDPAVLAETEERAQLRAVLRDLFAAASGPDDDRKLWSRLAGEIGVPGLAIPEQDGGSGFSFTELAVALEEAGRALAGGPLLSTAVLAGYTLLLAGDPEACRRYLPGIAAGTLTATVAGFDDHGDLTATPEAGGWTGTGRADFVLDGAGADLLLIAAPIAPEPVDRLASEESRARPTPDAVAGRGSEAPARPEPDSAARCNSDDAARPCAGLALFACAGDAPGLTRQARTVLDDTRPQALVTLRRTPLIPIDVRDDPAAVVARVLDIGRAALAAEQVGGSAHALDATVAYVRERHQFGQPIGSFQAVQHRLADLLVEVEAARSAAAYAAACVTTAPDQSTGWDELAVAAAAAQVVCSETFRRATEEYVQLHGGIGFTWEHPAHRYVRRARSAEVLFGTADDHRARLARLLGLAAVAGEI